MGLDTPAAAAVDEFPTADNGGSDCIADTSTEAAAATVDEGSPATGPAAAAEGAASSDPPANAAATDAIAPAGGASPSPLDAPSPAHGRVTVAQCQIAAEHERVLPGVF